MGRTPWWHRVMRWWDAVSGARRFYVFYEDGQRTFMMNEREASEYAEMFNGAVVWAGPERKEAARG